MPKETMPSSNIESSDEKKRLVSSTEKLKQMSDEELEEWIFGNKEKPEYIENKAESESEENSQNPYEKHWNEGVKNLREKYLGAEISHEVKDEANEVLNNEEEETKLGFVRQWISDNKDDLEYQYPQTKAMDEERLIRFALVDLDPEKNPLNQLKENEDVQTRYRPYLDKMENLYILEEGMKKDTLDPEVQFLALNHFYEKAKEASKEYHRLEKDSQSSPEEIENAKKEWFKQSKIVKELTEKITGKNPKELAEQKTEASAEKEKKSFMDSRLNRLAEIKSKRHNQILGALGEKDLENVVAGTPIAKKEGGKETIDTSKDFRLQSKVGELTRDQVLTIVGLYGVDELRNIKHKNWFSNKIIIGGQEIKSENFDAFLAGKKRELDEKIKAELEDAAEFQWKKKTKEEVGKNFDEIIKETASPKGAEWLVREKYRNIKKKMVEQWEKEEKEKPKKERLTPEKEQGPSKNADSALEILKSGLQNPEQINDYLKDHSDDFSVLMESMGVKIHPKNLENFVKKEKNRKSLSKFIKRWLQQAITSSNAA